MDTYYEKLIKRKKTNGDKISQWFMGIIAVLVVFLIFLFTGNTANIYIACIAPFLAALVCYVTYRYIISMNVEYEIIITNEYFDLDKIINKSKRKRLVSTQIKNFNNFAKYDKGRLDKSKFQTKIYAYNLGDENLYYVDVREGKLGDTLIVFSADDEMLSALKAHLSGHIVRELSK